MNSFFADVPSIQPDPILGVIEAFRKDSRPNKVNLGVGMYQDNAGRIPILESVKQATAKWIGMEDSKAYTQGDGLPSYNIASQELLFGKDSPALREKRVCTVQAVGGSGALKLGIELLHKFYPSAELYISDPSWENHRLVFEAAGLKVHTYPYYDPKTNGLRTAEMLEALRKLPTNSIVLLHACCHNPTGVDIDINTWREVAAICTERSLIPFIDAAYQGFAEGLEADVAPVRLFVEKGITFVLASSYAKSFSLYRERCGTLSVVTGSETEAQNVLSQLKRIVRTIYSSPPSHGAQVVAMILTDPELRSMWEQELGEMRLRIQEMRKLFTEKLREVIPDRDFSFIMKQRGMFSYSGLSREAVVALREQFAIYAIESGRICVAAMNPSNIDYTVNSIAAVLNSKG
jgi:aromatic-amino-acid transaminase